MLTISKMIIKIIIVNLSSPSYTFVPFYHEVIPDVHSRTNNPVETREGLS